MARRPRKPRYSRAKSTATPQKGKRSKSPPKLSESKKRKPTPPRGKGGRFISKELAKFAHDTLAAEGKRVSDDRKGLPKTKKLVLEYQKEHARYLRTDRVPQPNYVPGVPDPDIAEPIYSYYWYTTSEEQVRAIIRNISDQYGRTVRGRVYFGNGLGRNADWVSSKYGKLPYVINYTHNWSNRESSQPVLNFEEYADSDETFYIGLEILSQTPLDFE